MADVFLNSATFAPHAFLTLAPPSCYALNLKASAAIVHIVCLPVYPKASDTNVRNLYIHYQSPIAHSSAMTTEELYCNWLKD